MFAESACSGGQADANMVNVTVIKDLLKSRMTRRIQVNNQELGGRTGAIRENRHIGAVEVFFTRYHTARDSLNTLARWLRIAWQLRFRYSRTVTHSAH